MSKEKTDGQLAGKTIFITGSSRGIGKATALLAHARGAEVICHGSRQSQELDEVVEKTGGRAVVFDAYDEGDVRKSTEEMLEEVGTLDGLVNCAGTLVQTDIDSSTFQDYEEAVRIHVAVPNIVSSLCAPLLERNGGSIVNVSSVRSGTKLASTSSTPYSAMKGALNSLTCSQAKKYAPYVRSNSVSPGWTETDMSKGWNAGSKKRATDNLLQRMGKVDDIAMAICFLLSDDASFITGENLFVDGGYALSRR